MPPFLALITPVDPSAAPTPPIYNPPGIWGPTDPRPGWGLPGQPPGIWGGGNQPFPTPPIVIPQPPGGGPPVVIWPNPGRPTHPIVIPLPPIDIDAHPEHPIVLPPPEPPGIWGPLPGFPTPPIVIPPWEGERLIDWQVVWSPTNGWQVIGTPNPDHPAPSGRRG